MGASIRSIRKRLLECLDLSMLHTLARLSGLENNRKYSRKYLIDYLLDNWSEYCNTEIKLLVDKAMKG